MIGSGIFGNTGLIQERVGNPGMVVALWFIGGMIALAGALCYAELSTLMPHAGGEYVYLKNIFGLLPSFLTGWVSFIVAFSAPAAAAALLSSEYVFKALESLNPESGLTVFLSDEWNRKFSGCAMVIFFTSIHMIGVKAGSFFQNVLTVIKMSLVVAFVIAGFMIFWIYPDTPLATDFIAGKIEWSGTGAGLLYVMFAYSGWNSATYLAEEIRSPEKNLPRALIAGTILTTSLYVILNLLYFMAVPAGELSGERAIAAMTAESLFGANITILFNLGFFFILLSTLSATLMIGPRVYFAMARDNLFFKAAAHVSPRFGTPTISFMLQAALAIIYILSGTYEQIQIYMGFALSIFPVMAVAGILVLKHQRPDLKSPYKTPFYPLFPVFFIIMSVFTMVASLFVYTITCLIAIAVVLAGIPFFFMWMKIVHPGTTMAELRKSLMNLPEYKPDAKDLSGLKNADIDLESFDAKTDKKGSGNKPG